MFDIQSMSGFGLTNSGAQWPHVAGVDSTVGEPPGVWGRLLKMSAPEYLSYGVIWSGLEPRALVFLFRFVFNVFLPGIL